MSATSHVTIWCDHVGPHPSDHPSESYEEGERCVEWVDHGLGTSRDTLKSIADEGWRRVRVGKGQMDLCPRHAEGTTR